MGMYEIPRNTKGEGRILYIFSTKALIYTVGGILLGIVFRWLLNLIGSVATFAAGVLNGIGIALIILFALIGFALGTVKIPQMDKFEITRKAAGINLDTVVKEYIKFHFKKDKYYTYNRKDLVREEIEREEKEKEEKIEKSRREIS